MNYTKISEEEILKWLQENLDEKRYLHSLGTAQCAKELADKYGLDGKKAYIAGLLHDCAKCFSNENLLQIMNEKLAPEPDELINPKTWHAPVSAYIARREFGLEDETIISSIRWHTLGKLDMTDFEKIIFLADKIEPKTRQKDYVKDIRASLNDEHVLNKAIYLCYKETIKSLVVRDLKICPATIDIYNHLNDLLKQ